MFSSTTLAPLYLFGNQKPFTPPSWQTKDDRIRGGASQSYLSLIPETNSARFHGHLDTSTLGGAGFASQFSAVEAAPEHDGKNAGVSLTRGVGEEENGGDGGEERYWDLSAYDGIGLIVEGVKSEAEESGEGKNYTFILRDEVESGKRDDGREKAGVNWQVKFRATGKGEEREQGMGVEIWIPWDDFRATYRGKEIGDAGRLKVERIRRVGLMMRSYFGQQDGDFSLVIHSISARKAPSSGISWRACSLM